MLSARGFGALVVLKSACGQGGAESPLITGQPSDLITPSPMSIVRCCDPLSPAGLACNGVRGTRRSTDAAVHPTHPRILRWPRPAPRTSTSPKNPTKQVRAPALSVGVLQRARRARFAVGCDGGLECNEAGWLGVRGATSTASSSPAAPPKAAAASLLPTTRSGTRSTMATAKRHSPSAVQQVAGSGAAHPLSPPAKDAKVPRPLSRICRP